ncbi:MAG TPA: D-alanyl-D-alanine carboxypeptidase family protein [Opitutaceae bacterium]
MRAAAPAAPYKGAVIMDAATGNVLFEENADVVTPPASVTKLMTFLIVYEQVRSGKLSLDTPVTTSADESRIGGTQVWLKEHETFTVDELLYALMIQSANDAAAALARAAAGSREAFVELMNERARDLGMKHTTFRSPHGLPPPSRRTSEGDLTSPRDLALLSRELLLKTDILRYTAVKTRPFGAGQRAQPVVMNNHNHLVGRVRGVDGLKTGFTNAAGFCLAATGQRDGKRVIAVVMGSPDRKTRDLKMADLIERGFRLLPESSHFVEHTAIATAKSSAATTAAAASSPISAVPAQPEEAEDPDYNAPPTITPAPENSGASQTAAPSDELPSVKFVMPKRK